MENKSKYMFRNVYSANNFFSGDGHIKEDMLAKSIIAKITLARQEYDAAIQMYKEYYALASAVSNDCIAYNCLKELVNAYEFNGDYENAFKYLKLVIEILSSLQDSNDLVDIRESKAKLILHNMELTKRNQDHENKIKQLNLIAKVGKKITSTTNERELFETIVDTIYDKIKVTSLSLLLVDEKNRSLRLKYKLDEGKIITHNAHISFDDKNCFVSYCAREQKDLFINDLSKEGIQYIDSTCDEMRLEEMKKISGSLICCRLHDRGRLIGILTVESNKANVFNDFIFETIQSIASYVEISLSNANKNKLLEKLSHYDELTGLRNRRSFMEYSERLSSIDFKSIAFIISDMNNLKAINDNISHMEGDKYLINISKILRRFGSKHQIFRLSGDEFAIILINQDERSVIEYINEVKRACAEERYYRYPLSLAMGYSFSNEKTDIKTDIEKLIIEAETNMYKDKADHYNKNKLDRRRPI